MQYDVVALGEILIDFTAQSTDAMGYPTLAAHPGGAPGNFLAALAKYGAKTAFIGKVGTDAFGSLLCQTLEQAGIGTRGVVRSDAVFTTLAFVTLDEKGDRSFHFARKPGADTCLCFDEIDTDLLRNTRVFHFGPLSLTAEPSRGATIRAVALAKENGCLITFDPNLRLPLWNSEQEARHWMLWGLKQADVVKISGEEAGFLWGCTPEEAAKKLLEEYGVQLAMVTLGAEGCLLCNVRGGCRVPAAPVQPVDTTGAGDIFGGSALSQLLRAGCAPAELSAAQLREIGRFATAAAGLSTLRHGGISSVPELDAVQTLCRDTTW